MRIYNLALVAMAAYALKTPTSLASSAIKRCQEINTNSDLKFSAWIDYSEGCRNSFSKLDVLVHDEHGMEDRVSCSYFGESCVNTDGKHFYGNLDDVDDTRTLALTYLDQYGKSHEFKCGLDPW